MTTDSEPSLPRDLPLRLKKADSHGGEAGKPIVTAVEDIGESVDEAGERNRQVLNEASSDVNENEHQGEGQQTAEVELVLPEPKKKKRSKKPKSKRGKNKPTGFEEYYVDPPITLQEHQEEKEIYDVSRPLLHRIELAILRFQKKRRIETERREVFLKYLAYGGVDVSPRMFGGVDNRDLQEMDKDEILVATGQASIDRDRIDLPIDFDAVVRGYLTSFFPYFFNPDTEDMVKLATVTIRNFLTYLLYHDVCPEYKENIDQARTSCDIAGKELWKNQQFTAKGPGDFNTACSALFGGYFYDMYAVEDEWENPKDEATRMNSAVARKVVKFAIAGAGSDEQAGQFQALANADSLRATHVKDIDGFEVISLNVPDADTLAFYGVHASDLQPVGRVHARAYRDPGKPRIDLSPEEKREWEEQSSGVQNLQEFDFFLEEDLLRLCYPGMKVITSIWELNCGLFFFDEVFTAYSSIYTVLANDLMLGWKKPRDLVAESEEAEAEAENESAEREGAEPVNTDYM
ncbi:hypothetical protein ASPZODRAFT_86615 [Penicilliopsis zonata CBS 506.65]|uniref:Argonaute complex, subunit Arb1 n=1 Tax=Penicilliopsis zonata CBS 506.65 TaxID=1073090 RepID=A0A1L9SUK0_9EURO|nr:hypothetical protein ASPZODRAFT_86615 [Penicilliopsis zonata CBS 506.65]OJJ50892.1 hypothetical protein ASPZODRAFT_86615 [Penicilliopsis zonata CBS 506.65]